MTALFGSVPARLAEAVKAWLTDLRERLALQSELNALGHGEVERVLKDCRLSMDVLPRILRRPAATGDLLPRLMGVVGVDRSTLARNNPAGLRELEVVCTSCPMWRRCQRELHRGIAGEHYETFCPNAVALNLVKRQGPLAI